MLSNILSLYIRWIVVKIRSRLSPMTNISLREYHFTKPIIMEARITVTTVLNLLRSSLSIIFLPRIIYPTISNIAIIVNSTKFIYFTPYLTFKGSSNGNNVCSFFKVDYILRLINLFKIVGIYNKATVTLKKFFF